MAETAETETPRPLCATCRHFKSDGARHGWCKRYPPAPSNMPSHLPKIPATEWCGEHAAIATDEPTPDTEEPAGA